MTIRERKLTDVDRWPVHTSRAIIPTIVLQGFWGHLLEINFVVWKWRRVVQLDWRDRK